MLALIGWVVVLGGCQTYMTPAGRAEKAGFKSLVGEPERNWPRIVERTKQGA
ncbi:MAG: hypothetical protein WC058_14515 [Phycisphaeraceae bacterium]